MAQPPVASAVFTFNGWRMFGYPLFLQQVAHLEASVKRLARRDPREAVGHRDAKILAAISKMAFEVIPSNPAHPMFLQGNTLGPTYRNWRRAKFFAGRYRLFFQFSSGQKIIILAWVNDEETLRTYGRKTDAYAVFQSMLGRGDPPADWNSLLKASVAFTARATGR